LPAEFLQVTYANPLFYLLYSVTFIDLLESLDGAGNLYFADSNNHAIRMVNVATGIINTVAGVPGVQGYQGEEAMRPSRLTSSLHSRAITRLPM
jgi:hypothetical protein